MCIIPQNTWVRQDYAVLEQKHNSSLGQKCVHWKGTCVDELVGLQHRLNGREFERTPGNNGE